MIAPLPKVPDPLPVVVLPQCEKEYFTFIVCTVNESQLFFKPTQYFLPLIRREAVIENFL